MPHITAYAFAAFLNAYPAILGATEWRRRAELFVGVDPDCAAFDCAAYLVGSSIVFGPDTASETVHAIIGLLNKIVVRVERQNDEHGAEYFLLANAGTVLHTL